MYSIGVCNRSLFAAIFLSSAKSFARIRTRMQVNLCARAGLGILVNKGYSSNNGSVGKNKKSAVTLRRIKEEGRS